MDMQYKMVIMRSRTSIKKHYV